MRFINFLTVFIFILLVSFSFSIGSDFNQNTGDLVEVQYFYSIGCSACKEFSPFLEKMQEKYSFNLKKYEISSQENAKIFIEKLQSMGINDVVVPMVFIGDDYLIGNRQVQFESLLVTKLNLDKNIDLDKNESSLDKNNSDDEKIHATILGIIPIDFSVSGDSFFAILISTIFLAGADSLNICSITVLIFLIIYLSSIGSLKRVLKTGLVFVTIIYLFYFIFMLVLTELISMFMLSHGFLIRITIIGACLFASILLIKDFFFYGKGLSLSVPKSVKPILEKYLKQATLISTIIFALIASLVELPCTMFFPMAFSTILAQANIVGIQRIIWIAIYNLIYVLPLLIILLGVYFSSINIKNLDEKMQKNKTLLKLVSGVLLLLIAGYFSLPFIFG
jgi:thiol-disulfide isomerase/thioredoxin